MIGRNRSAIFVFVLIDGVIVIPGEINDFRAFE